MKKQAIALALAVLSCGGAAAADAGWGIQFHYDAFADKTYPMASMQELKEGMAMDAANLFIVCKDGGMAVIFQPERFTFSMGNTVVTGKFRGAAGVQEFQFGAVDAPVFGKVQAITGADSTALLGMFREATAPVPYQADKKSGNFPIAGFADVDAIMTEKCAAL